MTAHALTPPALIAWLESAGPGERALYHRGISASRSGTVKHDAAQTAWQLYRDGAVTLVQRRDGREFRYEAVKLRVRRRVGAW